jgi:hypothetical protein
MYSPQALSNLSLPDSLRPNTQQLHRLCTLQQHFKGSSYPPSSDLDRLPLPSLCVLLPPSSLPRYVAIAALSSPYPLSQRNAHRNSPHARRRGFLVAPMHFLLHNTPLLSSLLSSLLSFPMQPWLIDCCRTTSQVCLLPEDRRVVSVKLTLLPDHLWKASVN